VRIGGAEKIERQAQPAEGEGQRDEAERDEAADAEKQGCDSHRQFARECALSPADPFFHEQRRRRSLGRLVWVLHPGFSLDQGKERVNTVEKSKNWRSLGLGQPQGRSAKTGETPATRHLNLLAE
jgi:hypothetical protein